MSKEVIKKDLEQQEHGELKEFAGLMQEVAELPQEQQAKVTYFAQGVIAASNAQRAAKNE